MQQLPVQYPSLAGQGMIAIDLETRDEELKKKGSGAHRGSYIAGVAVGTEAGFRAYYPIAHEGGDNLDSAKVFSWLKHELKDKRVPKVGARLVYDLGFLAEVGIEVKGPLYDIQNAEPLLDDNRLKYDLESISRDKIGEGKNSAELDAWLVEKFGKKNPRNNIWRAPGSKVAPYAISDIDLPLKVFAKQKVELERQDLWDLFMIESRLIPMLVAMRRRGVRVDVARAEEMHAAMTTQQEETSEEIRRIAGIRSFDPWSANKIADVFDSLGLTYPRTKKTDAPSFVAPWLDAHPHPIAALIRRVRWLDKFRGTFLTGCIIDGHYKGRVHCNFNQLKGEGGGAVSGRFSSSLPNLQFIPVRTEEGRLLREIFLAEEGQRWWKLDWSQIEYRLIVNDAAEMKLPGAQDVVERYLSDPDVDFHEIIAEMVFGVVNKETRTRAKTINFGLAYGEGKDKLARSLGVPVEEGEAIVKEYHKRAPFVRPLAQGCMNIANAKGEIITLLKRRRRFALWEKKNWKTGEVFYSRTRIPGSRRAFTHAALNARIQGSAADIMKTAMADIWESGACDADALGAPHLTVHDELDGSIDRSKRSKSALAYVKHVMETCVKLKVPLRADLEVGKTWGSVFETTEFDQTPSIGRGGGWGDAKKRKAA
jgi:DNA polymerase I-like protein with 3'-5' exonuclease and polymerase domains